MQWVRALVLPFAVLACSSTTATSASSAQPPCAGHHGGGAGGCSSGGQHPGGHPGLPAPVAAFHDVLRPLWHSDAGPERDTRTCAEAATLVARAGAVASAPAPEGADPARWTTATAALATSAGGLSTTCAASPRGDVGGGLGTVHTSFHELVELLPGRRH